MSSIKTKAIVIKTADVKDKDKLVYLYSLEQGMITASFKGVKGEKAKLKSAKELFCFGDFVIEQSKNLNIVIGVDIIDNFFDLTKDLDSYYEGCAILDIVGKTIKEANPLLFIEIIKALKTLCYDKIRKYYCIDKFLISIFKASGYGFLTDRCSSCNSLLSMRYFNLDSGSIVCPACKTAFCLPLTNACYSGLRILDSTPYEKLKHLKLGGMAEVQAYNLLCKNFQWRTGFTVINF